MASRGRAVPGCCRRTSNRWNNRSNRDSWEADALASRLSAKGLSVAKVGFEFGAKSVTEQEELSGHTFRADPGSEDQIAEICSRISGVGGIIHLAPLSLTGSSWESEGRPIKLT